MMALDATRLVAVDVAEHEGLDRVLTHVGTALRSLGIPIPRDVANSIVDRTAEKVQVVHTQVSEGMDLVGLSRATTSEVQIFLI